MVQVPTPVRVTVSPFVPEQVAIAVFELVKMTGLPDAPPVAETENAASPYVFADKVPKVIV